MPLKFVLAFALICTLNLAGAQNSSKYLKTLEQEGYTLYFIKPVIFKEGKTRLTPDFTFQYRKTAPETVELRFSLFSKTPAREMDYLSFHSGAETIGQSSGAGLMFLEQSKGKWHSRFSTQISYSTLMAMLYAGEALEIRFHGQESTLVFPAGKKWRKMAAVVKEILSAEVGR